jgi:hypothetical protein
MEVIREEENLKIPRTAEERHRKRIDRLQSLLDEHGRGIDQQAVLARYKVWQKLQPQVIRLRAGLVLRQDPGASPIREFSASKSAAVQLLLISLFENQCRRQGRDSDRTPIPLTRPTVETDTAWLYLLALPTVDQTSRRTEARSPTTNRVAQIKTALGRLDEFGRIELKPPGTRGRFEKFRLLNEAANNRAGNVYYEKPPPNEFTIDIPVQFFLSGWVHALTDNEIIAYLFLLHQAKTRPEENVSPGGMLLPARAWMSAFENNRAHEAYRFLSRFGLVQIARDIRRRADGTVVGLKDGLDEDVVIEPHRFRIDLTALGNPAVPAVISDLTRFLDGEDLDTANGYDNFFK